MFHLNEQLLLYIVCYFKDTILMVMLDLFYFIIFLVHRQISAIKIDVYKYTNE